MPYSSARLRALADLICMHDIVRVDSQYLAFIACVVVPSICGIPSSRPPPLPPPPPSPPVANNVSVSITTDVRTTAAGRCRSGVTSGFHFADDAIISGLFVVCFERVHIQNIVHDKNVDSSCKLYDNYLQQQAVSVCLSEYIIYNCMIFVRVAITPSSIRSSRARPLICDVYCYFYSTPTKLRTKENKRHTNSHDCRIQSETD